MNTFICAIASLFLVSASAQAGYIQVAENGGIVSYPTLNNFANATSGSILGFVTAYGDDAGFFFRMTF